MKTEWKSNSTEPTDLSGVGALIFDTGTVHLPLPAFTHFHTLTTLLEREIRNAEWAGRKRLKQQIAGIEI